LPAILVLHSAFLPPQPQPQPSALDVAAAAGVALACAGAACISVARVRSLDTSFALPPLDIAKRRLREAWRLTAAGVAAIFPGLLVDVADKLERGAAAAPLTAEAGAAFFGLITPEGRAGAFAALPNAVFPFVDNALRLSRLNCLVVLVAGCAIVNPVASRLLNYYFCNYYSCKTSVIKPFIR
jgi:predicted short-subunit dehydrogenase-like oxidoreductase (DUF2520 family)